MKKIILITLFLCSQIMVAQDIYNEDAVDVKPSFPGGWNNYMYFVQKNFKWVSEKNAKHITIEFIVQITGSLTDIKVINPTGSPNEKEALRAMSLSPKWAPGALTGKAVPVKVIRTILNPYVIDGNENNRMVSIEDEPADIGAAAIEEDNLIYNFAGLEVKPEYPGGIQEFYEFFKHNFKMPEEAKEIKGKIFVTFIIEKDGSLSDIKVIRDMGYGTGKEAIRVLKMAPRWIPGQQNGKLVRVLYALPFLIDNTDKTTPEKK